MATRVPHQVALHGYRDGRQHSVAGRPITMFTDFDVAAYTRAARGRIDVEQTRVGVLPEDLRDDLSFLWRLDSAALSETRALLASWTGNEARITAFVATWAYERLWLSHALRELLTSDGSEPPAPLGRPTVRARLRGWHVERILPLTVPVWTNLVGESVVAGQMARLAVQEASLQAACLALAARADGEACRVLGVTAERRETMIRFFQMEASARISRSPQEARMAGWHLGRHWRPFRVVGVADPDEGRALASIFREPSDRARLERADAGLRRLLLERPTGFWGATAPSPGLLTRKGSSGVRP